VDIEFAAQYLQLIHAHDGGPLASNTSEALSALVAAGLGEKGSLAALLQAWRLQQDLAQLLKVALDDDPAPADEPRAFQRLLARSGGSRTFKSLLTRLSRAQADARRTYRLLLQG